MRTYLDCIPCFFKQALEAGKLAGADEIIQKRILDEFSKLLPELSLSAPPPEIGRVIYQVVKDVTQSADPFKEIKDKSNRLALNLLPNLRQKLKTSDDSLFTAVELAIAGNVIDYGVKNSLKIEEEVKNFLNGDFDIHLEYNKPIFTYQEFRFALEGAGKVLYLADNAGETVFDRVLIEEIRKFPRIKEVFYAVKDKPIINDALKEDAVICGIDEVARVISSGCDAPGTILKFCSEEFLKVYKDADLVISKGQGNFEALSEEDRSIYFLFRVKCEVVARDIGCQVGDVILMRGSEYAHI
jgi:uncharacterized protein with ATP-grasp and redox domains